MSSSHQPKPHTVEVLRNHGFMAKTVEHRIEVFSKAWADKFSRPRQDLFGIFDVLTMKQIEGIIGIQTTDAQDTLRHRKKMLASQYLEAWLQSGGRAQLWQWQQELKGSRQVYRPHILEAKIVNGVITFVPVSVEDWLGTLHSKKKPTSSDDQPEANA